MCHYYSTGIVSSRFKSVFNSCVLIWEWLKLYTHKLNDIINLIHINNCLVKTQWIGTLVNLCNYVHMVNLTGTVNVFLFMEWGESSPLAFVLNGLSLFICHAFREKSLFFCLHVFYTFYFYRLFNYGVLYLTHQTTKVSEFWYIS